MPLIFFVNRRGRSPRTVPTSSDVPPQDHPKYIVFEGELLKLFKKCFKCGSRKVSLTKRTVGTFLSVFQRCGACKSKETTWSSQPWLGATPAGNLLLSAAVLFAGASPSQALRMLTSMGVACISLRTFFSHQKIHLLPSVEAVWAQHITEVKLRLKADNQELVIGGDGRADSPGHSAKYGSYTAIELNANKIVDIQLVQCNEVKSSYHMELEGFKRTMATIREADLTVTKLITDRHRSLAKYVREHEPTILHMYDVWHIAKGIKKKVDKLAKKKGFEGVAEWKRSINNHVYWCASSTTDAEEDLREAKWASLCNHIVGVHRGHSALYPKCDHGRLGRRKKKWLKPGTEETTQLYQILESTSLLKDIRKMSSTAQTSSLESFHSLINQFAPKMKAYSYDGMTCRVCQDSVYRGDPAMLFCCAQHCCSV
ncbi:uncharacterized protein LOC110984997 isoform X2 [Acanthaster planci]|uniref:Uncharacterized protein LOC110984997 isoform X2 n=1 Tax=Acanthaster planci TaxID=133434 RepID=A0A8B7Z6U2_ACAPL|nr:uncharacterized protein LOC110984997 isoform X2 [Acanthaster planci]